MLEAGDGGVTPETIRPQTAHVPAPDGTGSPQFVQWVTPVPWTSAAELPGQSLGRRSAETTGVWAAAVSPLNLACS
jgi:hypothetical protein